MVGAPAAVGSPSMTTSQPTTQMQKSAEACQREGAHRTESFGGWHEMNPLMDGLRSQSRPQGWSNFRVMRGRWFIFQQRCDTDYFWKSLTSPSSQLFSLTIGNDYFSIILLILGPIILGLFTD